MKIRFVLAAGVLLVGSLVGVGAPAEAATSPCHPGVPANVPATTQFYDPAKTYLGPDPLPTTAPVGPLLLGYRRFGALTEAQFVAKYRTGTGWIYPPDDGFLSVAGHVVRYEQRLSPGTEVDRFGYPGGAFLAPEHTLFIQRALPPQNLTSPGETPLSNYHLYCVLKPVEVDAGPIAPWFEQVGLGLQYKLVQGVSVSSLLTNGYLTEERP
jgi:hypothetical protein